MLYAVYYPTAYGSVATLADQSEVGQFESATAVSAQSGIEPEKTGEGAQLYKVDLRELELKAAKARAEAERAERLLIDAQMAKQNAKDQR
jgi:hypothetical protein